MAFSAQASDSFADRIRAESAQREDAPLDADSKKQSAPLVWLLLGEKRGDNGQVEALARELGWPTVAKHVFVHPQWREGKPRVRPNLDHIDLANSDALEGPWPDLVITAGRRLSSVALWIKEQSQGQTKMVLVGKPRRLLEQVDLAIIAAHYTLPEGPNVIRHDLPFMEVGAERLAEATQTWRPKLADLRRPLVALMVGGRTGGLHFDAEVARELMRQTRECVERMNGSLFITTSRRTPKEVTAIIEAERPEDSRLYVFDPDAGPEDNPYHGLLGLADHVIVTTDSISMMVEAARLGRGLSLFPLAAELGPIETALGRIGLLPPLSPRTDPLPAGGVWARTMFRVGRPRHSRDLSAISRRLVEMGLATWLDEEPFQPAGPFNDDALARVSARVRKLVGDSPAGL